jgi:hypothetical protein
MLIGHPAGLCGNLLSDSLIIVFRLPRHSLGDGGCFWIFACPVEFSPQARLFNRGAFVIQKSLFSL